MNILLFLSTSVNKCINSLKSIQNEYSNIFNVFIISLTTFINQLITTLCKTKHTSSDFLFISNVNVSCVY